MGGDRGPNQCNQGNFEPHHFSQPTIHSRCNGVHQRCDSDPGNQGQTGDRIPFQAFTKQAVVSVPQQTPTAHHQGFVPIPKSPAHGRQNLRMPGMFDRPLEGVAQSRGEPNPTRQDQLLTPKRRDVWHPNPTQQGGDRCPKRNPDVGE